MKFFALLIGLLTLSTPALAGYADSWQLGLQNLASHPYEVGGGTIDVVWFHQFVLYIIIAITVFVTALLAWVIIRYNRKANPNPADFSHNTMIEVVWTIVPVIILIVIGIPSYNLLKAQNVIPEPELVVKATGYQWYWGYDYPDEGISFMSYMIPDEEIDEAAGQKRLLETDTQLVLPIDTNIQILVTAADVLHSFAVPALGVKKDAVPGRLNETWVNIKKPGIYYGQCSEICGSGHAYMPIMVRAVSKEDYAAWLEEAREEFGALPAEGIETVANITPIPKTRLASIQE